MVIVAFPLDYHVQICVLFFWQLHYTDKTHIHSVHEEKR